MLGKSPMKQFQIVLPVLVIIVWALAVPLNSLVGHDAAYAEDLDLPLFMAPILAAGNSLRVTAPNGGETLTAGSWFLITWQGSDRIKKIDIQLSKNAGATYPITVAARTTNSIYDQEYLWVPVPYHDPLQLSNECKIRIVDSANPAKVLDESNGVFAIATATVPMTLGELFDMNDILAGDPDHKDSDGDGLYDSLELYLGTDPFHRESDGDGYPDYYEVFGDNFNQGDPVPNCNDGLIAALTSDCDGDGEQDYLKDSDGDLIPDKMEIYGYIYEDFEIKSWDGDIEKDFYMTNPKNQFTDGDQYNDWMEVTDIHMDATVKEPGDNPMIAAFPNFIVKLTDYTVVLNSDITETNGTVHAEQETWNVDTYDTRATTDEQHWEVGVEVEGGFWNQAFGGGVSVNASYGQSSSTTHTTGTVSSKGGGLSDAAEWSMAICSNPTQAAKIWLNLKLMNVGTCAAGDVRIKMNLYIGDIDTDNPIDTITHPEAHDTIDYIRPGDEITFPYGPINLTYDQLRLLQTGAPVTITIDYPDITADVYRMTPDGWKSVGPWLAYFGSAVEVSSHLFLDLGDGKTTEHLVYAGIDDWEPVVTLGDALIWAANGEQTPQGPFVSFYQVGGILEPAPLENWYFSLDGDTYDSILNYMQNPDFNLFDTVLKPGSVVVAKAPPIDDTPKIHWAVLSPQEDKVMAYVDDYFFSDLEKNKIKVYFKDKYGEEHPMVWDQSNNPVERESYYARTLPTNEDGTVYFKDGTEKIVAINPMFNNPDDPLHSNYRTELSASEMRYLPSFNYPYPLPYFNTPGRAHGVFVRGDYAYVADGDSGLRVIDISTPGNPVEIGFYNIAGNSYGVFVSEDYAYVAAGDNGLRVIDISTPGSPDEIGSFDTQGFAYDVFVRGDYAYVADWDNGLVVINISIPGSPVKKNSHDTPGYSRGVYVSGDYAYVADGDSGLRVISIGDLDSPLKEIGKYETWGANGVFVTGNYAYVADEYSGLVVIDISDPASPAYKGSYYLGSADRVFVSGNYAYVNGCIGFHVIDVSDPNNPTVAGIWPLASVCDFKGIFVRDRYAYLAQGETGFLVVDVGDPSNPTLAHAYVAEGWSTSVFVSGSYAYLAGWNSSFQVIDISNPDSPEYKGAYDTQESAAGVFVNGNYAYVAAGDKGLVVINISDPASPEYEGESDTPGSAEGVYVSENYAYVADGDNGLRVIDISTPGSPVEIGFFDTPGWAYDVFVSGDYAYVADGTSGLRVIDISTPGSPVEIGFFDTPGWAYDVFVSGDYAYVADSGKGLRVIDIRTNPGSPVEIGSYDTSGLAYGVHINGNYAYVADNKVGLVVIDVSDPQNPTLNSSPDTPTGTYFTPGGQANGVFVKDNIAYVACSHVNLMVMGYY